MLCRFSDVLETISFQSFGKFRFSEPCVDPYWHLICHSFFSSHLFGFLLTHIHFCQSLVTKREIAKGLRLTRTCLHLFSSSSLRRENLCGADVKKVRLSLKSQREKNANVDRSQAELISKFD